MIGNTPRETALFLSQVAADVEGAEVRQGEDPGLCEWIRIPTGRGYVGVWDAEELGEHGLFIQGYDLDFGDGDTDAGAEVTFAGAVDWIHERATVEVAVEIVCRYLEATAERLTRQSHIEQWQLRPEPQQPRLVSRYGCRVRPGQVT